MSRKLRMHLSLKRVKDLTTFFCLNILRATRVDVDISNLDIKRAYFSVCFFKIRRHLGLDSAISRALEGESVAYQINLLLLNEFYF